MNGHFICGRAYKGRFEAVKEYSSGTFRVNLHFFFSNGSSYVVRIRLTYEKGAAK